jgi:8-oxo-dGTP diphosphatase
MNTKPYFLAVRGVLIENRRVLLCQRSKQSKNQPLFWEFPGGKVDPGEAFAPALIREFKEETGLTITLEKILMSGEWEREDYRIAYLFLLAQRVSGEVSISREHDAYAWMTHSELTKASVSPQLEPLKNFILQHLLP